LSEWKKIGEKASRKAKNNEKKHKDIFTNDKILKLFNNSIEDINPLTLFIINNNLVALDNNSKLNFYDLKNFKLINTISIDIKDKNNDLLP